LGLGESSRRNSPTGVEYRSEGAGRENFRWSWLRSRVLDEIERRSGIRDFHPAETDRIVAGVSGGRPGQQAPGRNRPASGAHRRAMVQSLTDHPDQEVLIRKEARPRRAAESSERVARDGLGRASCKHRPCWAWSLWSSEERYPTLRLFLRRRESSEEGQPDPPCGAITSISEHAAGRRGRTPDSSDQRTSSGGCCKVMGEEETTARKIEESMARRTTSPSSRSRQHLTRHG